MNVRRTSIGYCLRHGVTYTADSGCAVCRADPSTILRMRLAVAQLHIAVLESQLAIERIRGALRDTTIADLRAARRGDSDA